jgi:hypothetical protein
MTTANPQATVRKSAIMRASEKLEVLTREQMLEALSPKARSIVEKADAKTKAFLLDGWRFGRSGMFE